MRLESRVRLRDASTVWAGGCPQGEVYRHDLLGHAPAEEVRAGGSEQSRPPCTE
jgi:hypothetical protein